MENPIMTTVKREAMGRERKPRMREGGKSFVSPVREKGVEGKSNRWREEEEEEEEEEGVEEEEGKEEEGEEEKICSSPFILHSFESKAGVLVSGLMN